MAIVKPLIFNEFMVIAYAGAPPATGYTDTTDRFEQLDTDSVLGLGIGMLAGGVVADLLGGGGLVTLGGAVVGGFLGIWTAEKVF